MRLNTLDEHFHNVHSDFLN